MAGVGVYADQLAAREGGHLYLTAGTGVGRQLGRPGILSPDLLNGHVVPHTADSGNDGAVSHSGQKLLVGHVCKARAGRNGQHGLGHIYPPDSAFGAVPGAVIGQTVLVEADLQTGVAEECIDIPRGAPIHCHKTPCLGGQLQHPVQALDILLGEIGLVVVQEVAVVRRQGVCVERAPYAGSLHRSREAGALDDGAVPDGVQSAGGGQRGHLVVGKGENVRAALQITQQHVLAVGFALRLKGNLNVGLTGIMGLE